MNLFTNILMAADTDSFFGGLGFTTENLPAALSYMGRGMAGIFIVLFIIYLVSILLQKLFPEKEEPTND